MLRHYDTLTYYLSDPRVAASNNLSERMLRIEKLIGNNAMFRQSLEGRFALDVMRTVLQTALGAEVDPRAYVIWVLQMPADAVAADPGVGFAACPLVMCPKRQSLFRHVKSELCCPKFEASGKAPRSFELGQAAHPSATAHDA